MTEPKTTRIPAPLYAAAGAGDYAYEQLRKLPAVVNGLSGKATVTTAELREKAVLTTAELREKAAATLRQANTGAVALKERTATGELDMQRLREAARRNAAVVVAGAQVAQERALAAYAAMVARGERVVGTGVVQAAETVNADMEATEAPAEVTATPATVAPAVETSPVAPTGHTATRSAKSTAKPTGPAKKATGPAKRGRPATEK
ncbi:hypothetical protein O7627_30680 [Solwaraspora sp. WMMD1047]|uniref:hypothetical protein n=1 Tax=Solwaraspora sp. WMMD1047 TaxID=3016102 RepID=UPI0024181102|nr:hypothetical protein [Solwaraspora sp. WMMD1047]MDG4833643.1 hypothetical protein [Solwaraspora sp. WMMD1047]